MPRPDVTAIVLAAGGSSRMGSPKGLLEVRGQPLIRLQVGAFVDGGLDVVVVLGAEAARYREALGGLRVRVAENPDWATTGMADSLRLGLLASRVAGRPPDVIVQPVDVPPVAPGTLAALLRAVGDAVPTCGGAPGHPVRLSGVLGPAERLDIRLARATRVPVDDPDCLLNLNTPADWAAWVGRRS